MGPGSTSLLSNIWEVTVNCQQVLIIASSLSWLYQISKPHFIELNTSNSIAMAAHLAHVLPLHAHCISVYISYFLIVTQPVARKYMHLGILPSPQL